MLGSRVVFKAGPLPRTQDSRLWVWLILCVELGIIRVCKAVWKEVMENGEEEDKCDAA